MRSERAMVYLLAVDVVMFIVGFIFIGSFVFLILGLLMLLLYYMSLQWEFETKMLREKYPDAQFFIRMVVVNE